MDWELILEAERRGILPADKAQLLAEARRRGLAPSAEQPKQEQQQAPSQEDVNAFLNQRKTERPPLGLDNLPISASRQVLL